MSKLLIGEITAAVPAPKHSFKLRLTAHTLLCNFRTLPYFQLANINKYFSSNTIQSLSLVRDVIKSDINPNKKMSLAPASLMPWCFVSPYQLGCTLFRS